jgi:hypothetical protein
LEIIETTWSAMLGNDIQRIPTNAIPQESIQTQGQIDAVYELSNIMAGNIKSMLSEPSKPSLPEVEQGTEGETCSYSG